MNRATHLFQLGWNMRRPAPSRPFLRHLFYDRWRRITSSSLCPSLSRWAQLVSPWSGKKAAFLSLLAVTHVSYTSDQHHKFLRSVKYGSVSNVQAFLKSLGSEMVHSRHPLGWTPLHVAAVNGKSQIVELLLKAGADPNVAEEYTTSTTRLGRRECTPSRSK